MEVTRVIIVVTITTTLMALTLSQALLPPCPLPRLQSLLFGWRQGGFMAAQIAFRVAPKVELCSRKSSKIL